MEKGIIYGAVGKESIEHFIRSYKSLRQFSDLPVLLFTDQDINVSGIIVNQISGGLSQYEIRIEKIKTITNSIFEKTLYLDADTYIASQFIHLFNILESFDIAFTVSSKEVKYYEKDIPDYFPEYNTGVIIYKPKALNVFFKDWLKYFKVISQKNRYVNISDEKGFRKALFLNNQIKYFVLAKEWNYFINYPQLINSKIKILHGKLNLYQIEKVLNSNPDEIRYFDAFT